MSSSAAVEGLAAGTVTATSMFLQTVSVQAWPLMVNRPDAPRRDALRRRPTNRLPGQRPPVGNTRGCADREACATGASSFPKTHDVGIELHLDSPAIADYIQDSGVAGLFAQFEVELGGVGEV